MVSSKERTIEKRIEIIKPLIKPLSLRKTDVQALAQIQKPTLERIVKKILRKLQTPKTTKIVTYTPSDIGVANLLWAIWKYAKESEGVIKTNREYHVVLPGSLLLAINRKSHSIYNSLKKGR